MPIADIDVGVVFYARGRPVATEGGDRKITRNCDFLISMRESLHRTCVWTHGDQKKQREIHVHQNDYKIGVCIIQRMRHCWRLENCRVNRGGEKFTREWRDCLWLRGRGRWRHGQQMMTSLSRHPHRHFHVVAVFSSPAI